MRPRIFRRCNRNLSRATRANLSAGAERSRAQAHEGEGDRPPRSTSYVPTGRLTLDADASSISRFRGRGLYLGEVKNFSIATDVGAAYPDAPCAPSRQTHTKRTGAGCPPGPAAWDRHTRGSAASRAPPPLPPPPCASHTKPPAPVPPRRGSRTAAVLHLPQTTRPDTRCRTRQLLRRASLQMRHHIGAVTRKADGSGSVTTAWTANAPGSGTRPAPASDKVIAWSMPRTVAPRPKRAYLAGNVPHARFPRSARPRCRYRRAARRYPVLPAASPGARPPGAARPLADALADPPRQPPRGHDARRRGPWALAAALSGALKFRGSFSLQARATAGLDAAGDCTTPAPCAAMRAKPEELASLLQASRHRRQRIARGATWPSPWTRTGTNRHQGLSPSKAATSPKWHCTISAPASK